MYKNQKNAMLCLYISMYVRCTIKIRSIHVRRCTITIIMYVNASVQQRYWKSHQPTAMQMPCHARCHSVIVIVKVYRSVLPLLYEKCTGINKIRKTTTGQRRRRLYWPRKKADAYVWSTTSWLNAIHCSRSSMYDDDRRGCTKKRLTIDDHWHDDVPCTAR